MYIGRDWKESCFIHGSRKRGPEKVLAMQEVGWGVEGVCTRSLELKWGHMKCLAVKRAGTKGLTLSWGGGGGGR